MLVLPCSPPHQPQSQVRKLCIWMPHGINMKGYFETTKVRLVAVLRTFGKVLLVASQKISASNHNLASTQVLSVLLQFLSTLSNSENEAILEYNERISIAISYRK